jgi:hypothetical protein
VKWSSAIHRNSSTLSSTSSSIGSERSAGLSEIASMRDCILRQSSTAARTSCSTRSTSPAGRLFVGVADTVELHVQERLAHGVARLGRAARREQ